MEDQVVGSGEPLCCSQLVVCSSPFLHIHHCHMGAIFVCLWMVVGGCGWQWVLLGWVVVDCGHGGWYGCHLHSLVDGGGWLLMMVIGGGSCSLMVLVRGRGHSSTVVGACAGWWWWWWAFVAFCQWQSWWLLGCCHPRRWWGGGRPWLCTCIIINSLHLYYSI